MHCSLMLLPAYQESNIKLKFSLTVFSRGPPFHFPTYTNEALHILIRSLGYAVNHALKFWFRS